jgi:hypothetical protein
MDARSAFELERDVPEARVLRVTRRHRVVIVPIERREQTGQDF